MRYMVDGHNLIPKLPRLGLDMLDDELELVQRLQTFCAQGPHQVEVYFDNASPGQAGMRRFGRVTAHFVRAGKTADAAIARRLIGLGRSARQWCVVSSDRSVQAAARAAQAEVLTSQDFAQRMQAAPNGHDAEQRDIPLNENEVDEWLRIFQPQSPTKQTSPASGKQRES